MQLVPEAQRLRQQLVRVIHPDPRVAMTAVGPYKPHQSLSRIPVNHTVMGIARVRTKDRGPCTILQVPQEDLVIVLVERAAEGTDVSPK